MGAGGVGGLVARGGNMVMYNKVGGGYHLFQCRWEGGHRWKYGDVL